MTRLEHTARALLETNPKFLPHEPSGECSVTWREQVNTYLGTRLGYHMVLNREYGRLYYLDDLAYLLGQLCRQPKQPTKILETVMELWPHQDPRYVLVQTYAGLAHLSSEGLVTQL